MGGTLGQKEFGAVVPAEIQFSTCQQHPFREPSFVLPILPPLPRFQHKPHHPPPTHPLLLFFLLLLRRIPIEPRSNDDELEDVPDDRMA